MKETIYFSHDYDAHNDPKLVKLRMKLWREGYWMFRVTLELMRQDANVVLRWCDIDANAFHLHCERNAYKNFLDFCVEIGLFEFSPVDDLYFSKRLQKDVEYMRWKSKKAKKSAEARWKARSNANALPTHSERNANKREENIREENKIEISPPHQQLIKDTLGETETWLLYEQMRIEIKKPIANSARVALLQELATYPKEHRKQMVLNATIWNWIKFSLQCFVIYC